MGLKILKAKDGKPRETWYARFTRNGQKVDVNLHVPIRGTVPTAVDERGRTVFDLDGKGDAAFEKSRARAADALAKMAKAAKRTGDAKEVRQAKTAAIARQYYRAREGKSIVARDTRLADLPKLWRALPRETMPTEARFEIYDATFKRFAEFAARFAEKNGGKCDTVNTITPEIATGWFDELRGTYAWETVKNQMSLLSGAYRRWATSGEPNPFLQIIKRHGTGNAKIQRKPLSEAEIEKVLDFSRRDPFYHPLIVTAACTGMRIGDVCHLKWADVDLRGGFIDCVTAKAGVRVTIPIFGALRKVLEERLASCADDEPFVFPAAAAKYDKKSAKGRMSERSTIVRGVKPYIARAVFGDAKPPECAVLADADAPGQSVDEVLALVGGSRFAPGKKERVADTYRRFAAGDSYAAITAATGRHKGQITQDLQAVEQLTGRRIRPGDKYARKRNTTSTAGALIELTRVDRNVGKSRGSIFGWHSFRTGFVVLAVENGVPIEDVQKIVGHTTVKMTMEYYRPEKRNAAERVRRQMRGTVLDGTRADKRTAIGVTVDADGAADGKALLPAKGRAAAVRALALARAVMDGAAAATVDAVLAAAGVDADKDPGRALALLAAAVDADTKAKIAAVIKAAGS